MGYKENKKKHSTQLITKNILFLFSMKHIIRKNQDSFENLLEDTLEAFYIWTGLVSLFLKKYQHL